MTQAALTCEGGDSVPVVSEKGLELSKLYGEEYYRLALGKVPYARSELPYWSAFFGAVAEELIRAFQPKRVLDAGCALGFLVEAFWDRGVESWGIDVSSYAISQVRRDLQPYCRAGSIADPIEGKYDLITCIEVLEHMPEADGMRAIENLTRATDTIVFSSTPYDVDQETHFNVRPIISWLYLFREHGFAPDLGFDLNFICDHAILFRRSNERLSDEVLRLYSRFVRQRHDILARDSWLRDRSEETQAAQARVAALEREAQELKSAHEEIQVNLEAANRHAAELMEARSSRGAWPGRPGEPARSIAGTRDDDAIENLTDLLKAQAAMLKSLEFRMSGIEERTAQVSHSLTGILESRIWRTLVKSGGLIQKVFR